MSVTLLVVEESVKRRDSNICHCCIKVPTMRGDEAGELWGQLSRPHSLPPPGHPSPHNTGTGNIGDIIIFLWSKESKFGNTFITIRFSDFVRQVLFEIFILLVCRSFSMRGESPHQVG